MQALKYLPIALPLVAHALIESRFPTYSLIPIYWPVLYTMGMLMGLSVAATVMQASLLTGGLFAVLLLVEDFHFAIFIPSVLGVRG